MALREDYATRSDRAEDATLRPPQQEVVMPQAPWAKPPWLRRSEAESGRLLPRQDVLHVMGVDSGSELVLRLDPANLGGG